MTHSFCAIAAQQSGEDLIGTAGCYQTYVLIECALPWAANVFESAHIPSALRDFISVAQAQRSVRFLAINRGSEPLRKRREAAAAALNSASGSADPSEGYTKLLIYEAENPVDASVGSTAQDPSQSSAKTAIGKPNHQHANFLQGYRGFEFHINGLEQVASCLDAYWQGLNLGAPILQTQDILVCTHGMRDKCCARFGKPFFKAAARLFTEQFVKQHYLPNIRVWRVSHIGGHRFAPTAIVLPEGRYYGRLTLTALQSLLSRMGQPHYLLRDVYRGWSLLPKPLQVLEQQLFSQVGWSWLDGAIAYNILFEDSSYTIAQLLFRHPNKTVTTYQAKILRSHSKPATLSCNAEKPSVAIKYSVAAFAIISVVKPKQPAIISSR